jgi:antitoxin component YwqK of YwqJK toxin-antitoxin module
MLQKINYRLNLKDGEIKQWTEKNGPLKFRTLRLSESGRLKE